MRKEVRMPLYEYQCESCRRLFEAYKRLSEEKDEERCSACGGRALKVGISLFRTVGGGPEGSGGGSCGSGSRRSPFG
jgi:putative FmdB family regulatory protein